MADFTLQGEPLAPGRVYALSGKDLLLCLAVAWDAAVGSLAYEDGSPVEVVSAPNPYRIYLEATHG